MTDSPQPSRPQQVTTAVVLSVAACILAVVNLFSMRDELRGSSFRDTLTEAQDRAGGLGVSNDRLVAVLEVLVLVSGALAAAAAVLAIYAWQRNRAAWIGFFVLAGLLAITLPVAGVVPVLLLAAGATFLASRPSRDWFAGRAPASGPAAGPASGPHVTLSQDAPGPPPGQADPPPTYGPWHGAAPGPTGSQAGAPEGEQPGDPAQGRAHGFGYPPGYPAPGYGQGQPPYAGRPDKRPGTVTAACAITWLGSFVVAALVTVVSLVLVADRGPFLRQFQREADAANLDVSQEQVLAITWTVVGITLFWCLAAAVLAVLAFRRSRGARIGLAVSAAMTVLVSVLLILSFVAVVPLLLGIAVLVLLFTGGANEWFARRPSYPRPPGGPPPPPAYQPPQPHDQQPPPPGRPGPW